MLERLIEVNVNADLAPDMAIRLASYTDGSISPSLSAADFIL